MCEFSLWFYIIHPMHGYGVAALPKVVTASNGVYTNTLYRE